MTSIIQEIEQVYQRVWDFRAKYSDYWTTPTPVESARYAFMEMGEVLDAEMRLANPHHNRRAEKEINLAEELADVAIMSCSVLPPDRYTRGLAEEDHLPDARQVFNLDELSLSVANLLAAVIHCKGTQMLPVQNRIHTVLFSIIRILEQQEAPRLHTVVADKLEAIYAKRIAPKLA